MNQVNLLKYNDSNDNAILYDGELNQNVKVIFSGKNNKLIVSSKSNCSDLVICFD